METSVWAILGILHTDNIGVIRSAYAAKLKALDLDRDTQAYMELRSARDEALWIAQNFDAEDSDEGGDEGGDFDPFGDGPHADTDQPLALIEAATDAYDAPITDDAFALPGADSDDREPPANVVHEQAIYDVLFSREHDGHLDEQESHDLTQHIDALLADPKMEMIDHAAHTETWLSEVLAQSHPLSDPFIARIADHFGWMARSGELGVAPSIAYLTQQITTADFIKEVETKGHPYYKAWRELRNPTNETKARNPWANKASIKKLLTLIRERHPHAEQQLDPDRVARWEDVIYGTGILGGIGDNLWWLWIVIAFQIAMAIGRCSDVPYQAPSLPQVSMQDPLSQYSELPGDAQDIDRALFDVFGDALTIADIKEARPELVLKIKIIWRSFQTHKRDYALELSKASLEAVLKEHENAGIRTSNLNLITERRRYELDVLTRLRPLGGPKVRGLYKNK